MRGGLYLFYFLKSVSLEHSNIYISKKVIVYFYLNWMIKYAYNCCWRWYFHVWQDFHLDFYFNFRDILLYGTGNSNTFSHKKNCEIFFQISFTGFVVCLFHIWEGCRLASEEFPEIAAKLRCHSKRSFL